ncbi:uncharacterized protein LOC119081731 [Bradysia coprophila]|uniref:uncharacterized protein LOC119081731 n=1 Tax=Bradysia coprophila TaxID=38358 RepID=UPI00187DA3AC|nr:uncharacterized protein LOC119081731 [Bradysia coprophila]
MKCVGLLFLVLLVQLFKWKTPEQKNTEWKSPERNDDISNEVLKAAQSFAETVENKSPEKLNYDDFRSKLNTTERILIPDKLQLALPLSDVSSDVLTAFRSLQKTLSDLSDCPSQTVSSVSTNLLELLDKRANKIGSLNEDGSSLSDVISAAFLSINDVLSSLDIGTSINDGVSKIEENLLNVIQVLGEAKDTTSNITTRFNDAIFSVAESMQILVNSIALLAEAATTKIGVLTEAKEAIISLTLVLQTTIIFVQSVGSSIASIALSASDRITPASSVLNSFLGIVDQQLPFITNALTSITSASIASSMSAIVSTISVTLRSFSYRFNQSLEKLQTSVLLQVSAQLETILFNLIGAEAGFASYVTTSAATIASSIAVISSSDIGIQSKTSRQLYPLFQRLNQLTGSDNEIAANFATSLPGILEIFKIVVGNFTFGLGGDLGKAIIKSIEDVFAALQKLANLLIKDNFSSIEMDSVTEECAKAVQVLASSVIAITKAMSKSINSIVDSALESVIALPILQSIVLYVAEWITILASSVSLAKTGEIHELVSSLAVTIVVILNHVSSIVETIAVSSTQPPAQIFSLILSPVLDFTKSTASISNISKVDAKVSAKIEVAHGRESDTFAIEGINSTDEKNLSELLNGLTGSLRSISSSFSSSLSSLNTSLKQVASSEFSLLQTVGVTLTSITTTLSNISGSANQILNVTFKYLHSIFGQLLDSASKLTNFGDLVSSLVKSISNISISLHSLLYAINDYKGSACYVNDSIREITKTIQILISTMAAIIRSSANASNDILEKLATEVAILPYLVFTVVLVIQQVLGAAIPSVSAVTGSIPATQHELTLAMFTILESLTSITTDVTVFLSDGNLKEISSKIVNSVSNLHDSTTASLSKISGVVANIQVTLGLANQAPAS